MATRLAGFLVKDDIVGIADMEPSRCTGYTTRPQDLRVCGTVTEKMINDPGRDTFMFQVLAGVSAGAFDGIPNDLVVSTESAAAKTDGADAVYCDHFGYLRVEHVHRCLKSSIRIPRAFFCTDLGGIAFLAPERLWSASLTRAMRVSTLDAVKTR